MSRAAEHRSRLPPRLHRPGLGRPHFHHHLVHGRERRRTGSQGNLNQPCVTRCEITHAQALAQAGFPNGINAVSSPPQCHLSPSLNPEIQPSGSAVQLMIFCCVSVSSNQRDVLDPLNPSRGPARGPWIVPIPFNASNPSPRRPHALDMQSKTTCSPSPSPAGPWSGRSNVRRG